MKLYDKIVEASDFVKERFPSTPQIAIITGTGLSSLTDELSDTTSIHYSKIPHFAASTVESHNGKLVHGKLNDKEVIILQGRLHYYEGYAMETVTFPIRVLKMIGIKNLIITNASGSLNSMFKTGDIVIVNDHISLFGPNPLRGIKDSRLGERFPDMIKTYDSNLRKTAETAADDQQIKTHTGIYAYVQGPSLETPAEHKLLQLAGADVVGMSTVPEVIVARQCGINVCVLSCVTNECISEGGPKETSLEEVIQAATDAAPKLQKIIKELVKNL